MSSASGPISPPPTNRATPPPTDRSTPFFDAEKVARGAGLQPELRHLSNSAAALVIPEARLDLVRIGIAAYGIDPAPGIAASAGVELRPVMTLRAQLINVGELSAGDGVSYGWTWVADQPTTVGLVPLGYADGVPRHAGNTARVGWRSGQAPVRGRICMDQFVVDLGPHPASAGDEVIIFGAGDLGEPTAADWATWCGTIGYEIVTRIGARVRRVFRNAGELMRRPTDGGSDGQGPGAHHGVTALAAGGIAAGLELERRIVAKRILRASSDESDKFFALRADGPRSLRQMGSFCTPRLMRWREERTPATRPWSSSTATRSTCIAGISSASTSVAATGRSSTICAPRSLEPIRPAALPDPAAGR